jgi:L-lysine exporter family protein LysE/ArgO
VRWTLWILGTIVLLVLAARMAREVVHPHALALNDDADAPRRTPARLVGYGMSARARVADLDPLVRGRRRCGHRVDGPRQAVWLTIGFALATVLWSALLAFAIASSRRFLGATLVRGLSAVSALLFLYFAVRIFLDGLRDMRAIAG